MEENKEGKKSSSAMKIAKELGIEDSDSLNEVKSKKSPDLPKLQFRHVESAELRELEQPASEQVQDQDEKLKDLVNDEKGPQSAPQMDVVEEFNEISRKLSLQDGENSQSEQKPEIKILEDESQRDKQSDEVLFIETNQEPPENDRVFFDSIGAAETQDLWRKRSSSVDQSLLLPTSNSIARISGKGQRSNSKASLRSISKVNGQAAKPEVNQINNLLSAYGISKQIFDKMVKKKKVKGGLPDRSVHANVRKNPEGIYEFIDEITVEVDEDGIPDLPALKQAFRDRRNGFSYKDAKEKVALKSSRKYEAKNELQSEQNQQKLEKMEEQKMASTEKTLNNENSITKSEKNRSPTELGDNKRSNKSPLKAEQDPKDFTPILAKVPVEMVKGKSHQVPKLNTKITQAAPQVKNIKTIDEVGIASAISQIKVEDVDDQQDTPYPNSLEQLDEQTDNQLTVRPPNSPNDKDASQSLDISETNRSNHGFEDIMDRTEREKLIENNEENKRISMRAQVAQLRRQKTNHGDDETSQFKLLKSSAAQRNERKFEDQSLQVEASLIQEQLQTSKFLSISEVKTCLKNQTLSRNGRYEILEEQLNNLENEHLGYFNGKKLPFSKNQSYRQCLFNPYTAGKGTVITVQLQGGTVEGQTEFVEQDNLTRKVNALEKNQKFMRISKFKQDEELFEFELGKKFLSFGRLDEQESKKSGIESEHYAVISFWQHNNQGEHQVQKPYLISEPLSRVINFHNGLREVLFTAHNFPLVFLFGRKCVDVSNQISLHIVGQPKSGSTRAMRANFQTHSKKNIKFEDLFKGIHSFNIDTDSFLHQQIQIYMKNAKEHSHFSTSTHNRFPMRAPTIIKVGNQILLVMTKSINKDHPTSLCFFRMVDDTAHLIDEMRQANDDSLSFTSLPTLGGVRYEIPGAEMFLGVDATQTHIFYLTNKRYCDPDSHSCSPAEARFSSPPIVRKISIEQLKELEPLMKQEAIIEHQSELELSQQSKISGKDPIEKINKIMDQVESFEVCGDQQSIDFYRCYSADYPYAEAELHDEEKKVTLFFNGLSNRLSATITFNLVSIDLSQEKKAFKERRQRLYYEQNNLQIKEHLEGFIQKRGGKTEIEVEAILNIQDSKLNIRGVEKDSGNEHLFQIEDVSEEWHAVGFEFYKPFSPIKIYCLEFDPNVGIKTFKCRHEILCSRFSLSPIHDAYETGACNYIDEVPFKLNNLASTPRSEREAEVTLSGWCRRTPFSTRIIAKYEEISSDGKVFLRRFIFEKKAEAVLCISEPNASLQAFAETEVCITYGRGKLDGQDLVHFSRIEPGQNESILIGAAHQLIKYNEQHIFVLNGCLLHGWHEILEQQNEDQYFQLTQVSEIKEDQVLANQGAESDTDSKQDENEQGPKKNELRLPSTEIIQMIGKGGEFHNENGLIYALFFESEQDIKLVSVGYEYTNSAPNVNFLKFNLRKVKNEDTGEMIDQRPVIQTPMPQQYIIDYPIIAYKSFMSDNSEIVITNLALKKNSQIVLRLRTWQFVCFVGTVLPKEFTEIEKFCSKIFFVVKNKFNNRYRILMLKMNPWEHGYEREDFGLVDCLQTAEFVIPDMPLNQLKKVELLVGCSDTGDELMYLIFQYEASLWSVCISTETAPKKLLPAGEIEMNKRYVIRNRIMEDHLYCLAYKSDTEDNKIVKIAIQDNDVAVCTCYIPQSAKLIALEMDPEDNEYLYCLDDEEKLQHLQITVEGKLIPDKFFDLSVHQVETLIESFKEGSWDSILIDNRSVTIKGYTFSLNTNFSYQFKRKRKEKTWQRSVGKRKEILLSQQQIPGTLLGLQIWKADEIYFFRAKPLPGTSIIDILGQWRITDDSEDVSMYFANDDHIMVSLGSQKILTFDAEGYIIDKEFSLYQQPHVIHRETRYQNAIRAKFFCIENKIGQITVVRESGPDQQTGAISLPEVLQDPFDLLDLQQELRMLDPGNLAQVLNLKNQDQIEKCRTVRETIQIHSEHLNLTKYGQLYLIASCVFEDLAPELSLFQEPNEKADTSKKASSREEFVYKAAPKIFGSYTFGVVRILIIVCRNKHEQVQLSFAIGNYEGMDSQSNRPDSQGVNYDDDQRRSYIRSSTYMSQLVKSNQLLNFCFKVIDNKLVWVNFEQRCIWQLELNDIDDTDESESFQIKWQLPECKSFNAGSLFSSMTKQEFSNQRIDIREVDSQSTIRTRKIAEPHDDTLTLVQFTIKNMAVVLNLTREKPFYVEMLDGIDEFRFPLYFSSSGFVYVTQNQTWSINSNQSLGFKRPFLDSKTSGLFRAFSEMDLFQLLKLKDIAGKAQAEKYSLSRKEVGDIEPLSASCLYGIETFFSLFAEQGMIYEVFFEQLKKMQDAKSGSQFEKQMLSPRELELFMRRLRYIITRPTPIHANENSQLNGSLMSILKQVVLFNDQTSRVSMYRLADYFDLSITDYISCTTDLMHVIQNLPQAQYFKVFDKFQQNHFTLQISQAVMPKKVNLKTFCAKTQILTQDDDGFGIHTDISDAQALRQVKVRVIPLDWVFVNGGSLSKLFRQFGSEQEKYQGSLLLDVMFDSFWNDFKWKIFFSCFVPYLFYFSCSFLYILLMLFLPNEESYEWDINTQNAGYLDKYEAPLRFAVFVLWLFHFAVQMKQVKEDGLKHHFGQLQNNVDLVQHLLTLTILICRFFAMKEQFSTQNLRFIGSFAGLFTWLQLVFWLRLFDSTAMYVSLIIRTIKDIFHFMIVMLFIMFGFSTAFYMFQMNRMYRGSDEDGLLYPTESGENVAAKSMVYQYYMMLGDFENINLDSEGIYLEITITLFFVLSTFLVQVTILNMLIAIMARTFDEHMSERDEQSKKQKLLLLSEYISFVEFYMTRCCRCLKKPDPLFVIVMTRAESGDDTGAAGDFDDGGGDVGESETQLLKRTMESRFVQVEIMMNKKIVRGIAQLGQDTKNRLNAMQQETKSKLNHIFQQLQADATKKFKLQMKHLEELKEVVTKDVLDSIDNHYNDVSKQIKKTDKTVGDINRMVFQRF